MLLINSERKNGNYVITHVERVREDEEVVIGKNTVTGEFVCWYCHNGDDYRAGFYDSRFEPVRREYNKRIGK